MHYQPLLIDLKHSQYPIHFHHSRDTLASQVENLRKKGRAIFVFTDQHVMAAQKKYLSSCGFRESEFCVLPHGEQTKSVANYQKALSFLAQQAAKRDCALFAFGGGVIGDLTGFVAASYLRGVDFYQIPSSLLAMVDSSVGGKTGINLPEGKNLVGAFWQPQAVYIDRTLLETLPPREFSAGMAEVIKYGLLADDLLFQELELLDFIHPDSAELVSIIRRCCEIKAQIVIADEKESAKKDGRILLNLGHTFAHAIESVAGYGKYLHGEAVAIGLLLAAKLSAELGQLDTVDIDRTAKLIQKFNLPIQLKEPLSLVELMATMQRDKKNLSGRQRFITLKRIGHATTSEAVDPLYIESLWRQIGAL
jgi:3-dehydroquinate synthase